MVPWMIYSSHQYKGIAPIPRKYLNSCYFRDILWLIYGPNRRLCVHRTLFNQIYKLNLQMEFWKIRLLIPYTYLKPDNYLVNHPCWMDSSYSSPWGQISSFKWRWSGRSIEQIRYIWLLHLFLLFLI